MSVNYTILKRLSFIKYLFQLGIKQSKLNSPQDSVSILMFHDSIEIFLQLSSEYLNANSRTNINFMDYWEIINQKLPNQQISQKNQMNRLNRARVNLKHQGILINKSDIESFRVNVNDFLFDSCSLIYGISFSDVSLVDLIDNADIRELLKDADKFIAQNENERALEHFLIAFKILIIDFEKKFEPYNKKLFGSETFFFESDDEIVLDDINKLSDGVKNLGSIMKYIVYGIDIKNYLKFSILTPIVYFNRSNFKNYKIINTIPFYEKEKKEYTTEQLEFCKEFIIDSAIRLQEFDFNTLDL